MTGFSWVPLLLVFFAFLTGLWPGSEPPRTIEKPKRGYWTIATAFWPLRRAYHDLWPHRAVLQKGQRGAWFIAFAVAMLVAAFKNTIPPARYMSTGWTMIEVAVVMFFLGRASGFWSADRRIMNTEQDDGATEGKGRA